MVQTILLTLTKATKATAVTNIGFKKTVSVLAVGKSFTLKAYTRDSAKNKDTSLNKQSVVFYSSDESVLSVTPAGKMTAKGEGQAVVTAVSLADPSIKKNITVTTYVAVKKIVLNATKNKVKKGRTGVVTVAQWNPEGATNKQVKWTCTGANGSTKAGNVKAIEIAVLSEGKRISDLKDSDFVDARTTAVVTKENEKIVFRTIVPTKKCVITATSVDGNKKAKYTVECIGEVTSLKFKTTKAITATEGGYKAGIKAGKSLKVGTDITAEYGANKKLIWRSDSEMVTVRNGTVKVDKKATKGTTAVVTAFTSDGKRSAKLFVTVE